MLWMNATLAFVRYEAIGDTLNIRHTSTDMVGLYRCVVEDIHGKILMGEAPVGRLQLKACLFAWFSVHREEAYPPGDE